LWIFVKFKNKSFPFSTKPIVLDSVNLWKKNFKGNLKSRNWSEKCPKNDTLLFKNPDYTNMNLLILPWKLDIYKPFSRLTLHSPIPKLAKQRDLTKIIFKIYLDWCGFVISQDANIILFEKEETGIMIKHLSVFKWISISI